VRRPHPRTDLRHIHLCSALRQQRCPRSARHRHPTSVLGPAAYIKVGGGWWTKPTFAQPTLAINPDGTARIPIVSGGSVSLATDIAVFLIPSADTPPGGKRRNPPVPSLCRCFASGQPHAKFDQRDDYGQPRS